MRVIFVLLVLVLAACQPTGTALPPVGEALISTQQAACEAEGGRWGTGPNDSTFVCYRTPADAGQACAVASDCEGLCLARSRTCAPVVPLFGCNEVLGRLGARTTLCVE